MKAQTTEIVLTPDKNDRDAYLTIKVKDLGAGPFLCIEGSNTFPDEGYNPHEFYLESIEQIDEFAEICKRLLRENGEEEKEIDDHLVMGYKAGIHSGSGEGGKP